MDATSTVTRQVVEGFLEDRLGHWLAHDVALFDMTAGTSVLGRGGAVLALDRLFRSGRPSDVRLVDARLVVAAGEAAARWVLEVGATHRLPMAATFAVEGGEICLLHLVYDSAALPGLEHMDAAGNTAGTPA